MSHQPSLSSSSATDTGNTSNPAQENLLSDDKIKELSVDALLPHFYSLMVQQMQLQREQMAQQVQLQQDQMVQMQQMFNILINNNDARNRFQPNLPRGAQQLQDFDSDDEGQQHPLVESHTSDPTPEELLPLCNAHSSMQCILDKLGSIKKKMNSIFNYLTTMQQKMQAISDEILEVQRMLPYY